MLSPQFLSSYCFFTAAVSIFQNSPEMAKTGPEQKAVVSAFKRATLGMSEKDQKALIEYIQRLLHLPKDFERDEFDRYSTEHELDRVLAKRGDCLIDEGHIILVDEFINRTGTSQEVLAQKLRERRIFKMPDWVHLVWGDDYFPAFFADSRYELESLESVSKVLRAYDGIRKYRFFTTSEPSLGNRTPLEALLDGKLELVLKAAKAFRKRSPHTK